MSLEVVDEGKELGRRDQISALEKSANVFFFSPAVPDKRRLTGYQMTCTCILNAISPSDSAKSTTYPKSQITYNIYDDRYNVNAPRWLVCSPFLGPERGTRFPFNPSVPSESSFIL
jgi:hypothetical protein